MNKTTSARRDRALPNSSPVGASGRPIRTVAGIHVEVISSRRSADGETFLTSVCFPVPGEQTWAVVQCSRDDGSRWMVGFDGWLHDEFPTIVAAVEAVCSPGERRALLVRTLHFRRLADLEAQARGLRDEPPVPPAGAVVDPERLS